MAFIATTVPTARGTVMAVNRSMIYLGLTVGAGLGGWLYHNLTYALLGAVAAGASLISIGFATTWQLVPRVAAQQGSVTEN